MEINISRVKEFDIKIDTIKYDYQGENIRLNVNYNLNSENGNLFTYVKEQLDIEKIKEMCIENNMRQFIENNYHKISNLERYQYLLDEKEERFKEALEFWEKHKENLNIKL